MPKSNVKQKEKYKRKYDVLNKRYEEECQKNKKWENSYEEICQENIRLKNSHDDMIKKNVKHVEINLLFHNAEKKWKEENSKLRKDNSGLVSELMQQKKKLKDEECKNHELEIELKQLREIVKRIEMEKMKEEIPNDFQNNLLKPEFDSFLAFPFT